jgi:predicted MFS family arabinose efflux permease
LVAIFGMRAAFALAAAFTLLSLVFLRRVGEPPALSRGAVAPPSSYRDALGDPGVRLIAALLAVTIFSLALGVSFVPTFLEDQRGLSPATIATISAMGAVGSATFGLAMARSRRLQRAPLLAVAITVGASALGFAMFRSTAFVPLLLLAYFCRGGLFAAWATLSAALGEFAPADHRARAFALVEMVGGVAFSLGPIAAGPLYSRRPTLPLEVAFVLALLLLPVYAIAQRKADRIHAAIVHASPSAAT